jgi:hypothetical protein
MATQHAETAVIAVLAPICVGKFQQQTDAAAKLVAFNKASSWDRRSLIEKGGWATSPGTEETEFGSCECLRRKARQLDIKTRQPIGRRQGLMTG